MQTLYYLGPAGTGRRKRTAAAAAQQGTVTGAEAGAADAAAEPEEAAGSKKGGKHGKRRKKGPADAGKENNLPEEEPAALQKSSSQLPAEPEVGGNAGPGSCLAFWLDRDPTACHCCGACHTCSAPCTCDLAYRRTSCLRVRWCWRWRTSHPCMRPSSFSASVGASPGKQTRCNTAGRPV